MKKYILSIFIILSPLFSFASNLVFNQVLTYAGQMDNTVTPITLTVPIGKVWKIEYIANPSLTSTGVKAIRFVTPQGNISFDNLGTSTQFTQNMWLKSGDQMYISSIYNSTAHYFISIIEYNVVP
jgi:hypothetical protein